KMAVTVDHLSGGRLEFGIGAAWAEAEHEMYGIEGLDHRGRPAARIARGVDLAVDEGANHVRRPLLPHQRRHRQPQTDPETTPADLDRGRGRPDAAGGGPLR